jgi:hypothetical protein
MQKTIQISTPAHNGLYDVTRQVEAIVAESRVQTGLVNIYAQGVTSAIMILFIFMYPRPIPNEGMAYRVSAVDRIYFREDGTIEPVKMTFTGVSARKIKGK